MYEWNPAVYIIEFSQRIQNAIKMYYIKHTSCQIIIYTIIIIRVRLLIYSADPFRWQLLNKLQF